MPHRRNRWARLWRHLSTDHHDLRRVISTAVLDAIEAAVKAGEGSHTAEIRVAFEPALSPGDVWRRMRSRDRALEVFGSLRVWDTENNNGVLIYVLLADQSVEIVADREASRRIAQADWDQLARDMGQAFARGDYAPGTVSAIRRLNELLAREFPADGRDNPDELPDRPALL